MKRIGIVSDSHGMRGMLEQSLIKLQAGGPLDALIHAASAAATPNAWLEISCKP